MKKKIMSLLLAAAMVCSLAACGSTTSTTETKTSEAASEATSEAASSEAASEAATEAAAAVEGAGADLTGKKVGFSALMMSSEFFTDMSNQMEAYFTERGMEYSVADAAGNAQTQIQTIENFVQDGCDYIIAFVVDKASIGDTLKKARDNGAFVIVIGTTLEDKDAADVCISISQRESGEQEAQMASDWIDANYPDAADGSIQVCILENSENEDAVSRCDGLKTIADLNSKVTVVYEQETTQADGSAAGVSAVENCMAQFPDTKVFLTYGTDQGQGANEYLAGHVSDLSGYAVFTVDTAEFIRGKIRESVDGTSALRGTIMLGEGTPLTCYNLMDGSWMSRVEDGVYNEQCIIITPDNIDEYFPE